MSAQAIAMLQKATQAAQQGLWRRALDYANELNKIAPQESEGYFIAGVSCMSLGQVSSAIAYLLKTIEIDGNRYDAAIELAQLYIGAHKFSQSYDLLCSYETKITNSPTYLFKAANAFTRLGVHSKAWGLYKKLNTLQSNVNVIQDATARSAVIVGNVDVAKQIYLDLLKRYPMHQQSHYEYSKLIKAKDNTHILQMLDIIKNNSIPHENSIFLQYAIGKQLEDLKQWDESYRYYSQAGLSILKNAKYNVSNDIKFMSETTKLCTRKWLDSGPKSTFDDSSNPIFIVGLPRSGTTLIERILSSHSQIESADETFYLQTAINAQAGKKTQDEVDISTLDIVCSSNPTSIASKYMAFIKYHLSGKKYFVDKLPSNFLYLGLIAKAFPNAKIVYVHRNPMDTCFALFKQSYFKFAYSLDDLGQYYIAHDKLRQHWFKLLGKRIIQVNYEALIESQETVTKALFNQVNIPFEQQCLDFHENEKPSATASKVQVRERLHPNSLNKWHYYEKHLSSLEQTLNEAGIRTR